MIVVELKPEEVKLLAFLQKNYENIKTISDSGVFDVKAKTVHLHINPQGKIKNIDVLIKCL